MTQLPKIIQLPFPESQYVKEICEKTQVVLHHTGSGKGADGDYKHWLSNPERVATSQIIEEDGTCVQLFNSRFWGYHLGITHQNSKILNQRSIALEIDNWGGLTLVNGVFKSWTGKVIPKENVVEYVDGFRGFNYFEKYTAAQIESVRKLLLFYGRTYNIDLSYNEDMWGISKRALSGKNGIWTHVSYKESKSDCHPQIELIQMLKGLK